MQLALVDCTAETALCKQHKVVSYPKFMYVRDGTLYKYNGERTVTDWLAFAKKLNAPPVIPIKSLNAIKSSIGNPQAPVMFLYVPGSQANSIEEEEATATFTQLARQLQGSTLVFGSAPALMTGGNDAFAKYRRSGPVMWSLSTYLERMFDDKWGETEQENAKEEKGEKDGDNAAVSAAMQWVEANKLPLVSDVNANNFDDVITTTENILKAIAVTEVFSWFFLLADVG